MLMTKKWNTYDPEGMELMYAGFLLPVLGVAYKLSPVLFFENNLYKCRLQIQQGVNMPARAELIPGREDKEKQILHDCCDVVLYLGIIDILQEYNMTKKIEHAYKSLHFDSLSISAVDPTFYSQRFLEFIKKVFPQNNNS